MSPEAPKKHRFLLIAARMTLAGFSAFLAAEIGARVFVGSPMAERLPIVRVQANEYRGWEMMPSELHYTYLHPVRVNALGLRGPEVELKLPGETRILTLGDSLLYGQGVADDQTVPAHMRDLLRERQPKRAMPDVGSPNASWTVINGGHRAYSTHQELGLLEELGESLSPDVVLVFWFWNDIFERDIAATNKNLLESGPIAFDVGKPVEGLVKLRWYATQWLRRSAAVMFLYDFYRAQNPNPPGQDLIDGALDRFGPYADRFQRKCDALGARLAYVIIPEPGGLLGRHFSAEIDRRAVEMLNERGIEVITLGAELQSYAQELGELPTLPFDGHYTGPANRRIAEAVVDGLGF